MVTQEEQDKKLASDQAEVGAANIIPQGQAASSASGVPPATDLQKDLIPGWKSAQA